MLCKYHIITYRYLLISYLYSFPINSKLMKLDEKIKRFFMFSIYIRLTLEAQQMMLISSFSEIKNINSYSSSKLTSVGVALAQIVFSCLFCCVIFYSWVSLIFKKPKKWRVRQKNRNQQNSVTSERPKRWNTTYMKELFNGLKPTFRARSFYLLIALRTLLVSFLIVVSGNLYVMITVQLVFILLVIWIRPMEKTHLNVIEVQGEVCTLCLMLSLIYFNDRKSWANGFGLGEEELFG